MATAKKSDQLRLRKENKFRSSPKMSDYASLLSKLELYRQQKQQKGKRTGTEREQKQQKTGAASKVEGSSLTARHEQCETNVQHMHARPLRPRNSAVVATAVSSRADAKHSSPKKRPCLAGPSSETTSKKQKVLATNADSMRDKLAEWKKTREREKSAKKVDRHAHCKMSSFMASAPVNKPALISAPQPGRRQSISQNRKSVSGQRRFSSILQRALPAKPTASTTRTRRLSYTVPGPTISRRQSCTIQKRHTNEGKVAAAHPQILVEEPSCITLPRPQKPSRGSKYKFVCSKTDSGLGKKNTQPVVPSAKTSVQLKSRHSLPAGGCLPTSQHPAPRKSLPGPQRMKKPMAQTRLRSARPLLVGASSEDSVVTQKAHATSKVSVRFSIPSGSSQGGTTKVKTPAKTPPTGRCSKTQASMRQQLDEWLKARGKTPSRFRHFTCFDSHKKEKTMSKAKAGLSTAELSKQQDLLLNEAAVMEVSSGSFAVSDHGTLRLEQLLSECLALLDTECPVAAVQEWLLETHRHMEQAVSLAKYWICKARLAELEGDDSQALYLFEQAVAHGAQPPGEVAKSLTDFVRRVNARQEVISETSGPESPLSCQMSRVGKASRREAGIEQENVFLSSAVKYCLSETTPIIRSLKQQVDLAVQHQTPRAVLTPVRRSTRRSCASLPRMFRDHDVIVESVEDLSPGGRDGVLYLPNKALAKDFEEAAGEDN